MRRRRSAITSSAERYSDFLNEAFSGCFVLERTKAPGIVFLINKSMTDTTKNQYSMKRRIMLISSGILVCLLLLIAAFMLARDCDGEHVFPTVPTATPAPETTAFIPQDGFEDVIQRLRGSLWQDKYDPYYTLKFDNLPSAATETNSFTGEVKTFTITSDDADLYLMEGQNLYRLYLSDGALYLDYGPPVGVVEFHLISSEES